MLVDCGSYFRLRFAYLRLRFVPLGDLSINPLNSLALYTTPFIPAAGEDLYFRFVLVAVSEHLSAIYISGAGRVEHFQVPLVYVPQK